MADQIASMFAKVGADTSGFERGMDGIKRSINAFEQMSIGAFRRVGELAIDGIGKAMETVGTIVSSGIDFNAMQEQATVAFETMLGSADKAQAFLTEMQDFAKTTPFEYPDLLVASRRLMALGFEAEEVLPLLTNIGDAVAAMGGGQEQIDRVTTALGQMRAKGRVQAEEMMQLTENGIAGWDMLAKHLGVDVATAMEMVTKKQVDAATGIAAIQAGIATDFGGMMAKQSTTWGGLISNLKDSFGMLSGRVMQPFFDVAKKGLEAIVNLVSSEGFIKGIDNFVDKITSGIDSVMNVVERFRNEFSFELAILTSDNASFTEKLIAIWDMLAQTGIKLLGSLVDSVGAMLPKWLEKLGEWGAQLWQWIVDNTPEALAQLGKWAGELWNWIIDNAPGWAAALWNWAVETWEWIVEVTPLAVAELVKWGEALWGWLAVNLPTWTSELAKWAEAAWKWLSDVIPIITTKVTEWGSTFLNWVITNAPAWGTKLAEWGAAAWQWLAAAIPQVATQIGIWGSTLLNWLATNSPTWQNKLTEWGIAAWQWLAAAIPQVLTQLGVWGTNVIGWFVTNLPTFTNTLLGWATWLVRWIGFALPQAIAALANFVEGLRGEGDGNGANLLGQMVSAWAKLLWQWITTETIPQIVPQFNLFITALIGAGGKVVTELFNLGVQMGMTMWQWLVTATPVVVQKLGALWDAMSGWLDEHLPNWETRVLGLATAFAPLFLKFTAIGLALGLLRTAWNEDWGGIQEKTAGAVSYIQERFGPLLTTIQTFGLEALGEIAAWALGTETDFSAVSTIVDETKTTFGLLWTDFATKFPETATTITTWSTNVQTALGDVLGFVRDDLVPDTIYWMKTWADIFTNSEQPGMAVVFFLGTTFPMATNQAVTAWQELKTEFQEITTSITDMFAGSEGLVPIIDFALTELILVGSGFVQDFGNLITGIISALNGDWEGALDALKEIGERKFNDFGIHADNFRKIFTGKWKTSAEDLQKGFQAGWDKEVKNSERRIEGFSTFIPSVMKDELDMRSPSRVMEGLGKNVVEGFDRGFDDKWKTFKEGSRTTVTSWVDWFRGIFGIKSPSTVFEGYGENIVAGLARGIDGASGLVYDAMGNISTGMTPYFDTDDDNSEDAILMRENNNLLRILIAELRNKNMTANVTVGGGGSYGSLVTHAAGMR